MTDGDRPADGMTGGDRPAGGFVELPRSVDLDPTSAARITAARLTRVVVIGAPSGCGKTSLLTGLYERFLRVPAFGEYCFAGSETLVGFERRCHPTRVASGLAQPRMEPTPPTVPPALLHLRVRRADLTAPSRDLLLTEIDGVSFQRAKDSSEAMTRLGMLKRADRLVLGVDGAQLANPTRRFAVTAAVRDFLRRACDTRMVGPSGRIDVVVMKWDAVEALDLTTRADATASLDRLSHRLRDDFRDRVGTLRFGRTAERPAPGSTLPPGYGLAELFPAWVEDAGFRPQRPAALTVPLLHREIDRFRPPSAMVGTVSGDAGPHTAQPSPPPTDGP